MKGLVGTMVGLQYLRVEEVPLIPTRKTALNVAVCAPLDAALLPPDVVPVRGNAREPRQRSGSGSPIGLRLRSSVWRARSAADRDEGPNEAS